MRINTVRRRIARRAPMAGRLARESSALAFRALIGGAIGVALGLGANALDGAVPVTLPVEVENAHTLLVTLVGALVTIAVFALWMRSVVVGQLASQFSARAIVHRLDDPFQRAIAAWMIGLLSFVSTVVVLIPSGATEAESGTAPVSFLAGLVAVAAGLLSVLMAIRHAADSLDSSTLVHRFAEQTFEVLEGARAIPDASPPVLEDDVEVVEVVRADRLGWVRDIDQEALLAALSAGTTAHLSVTWGSFVAPGHTLLTVDAPLNGSQENVRAAIVVGETREVNHDLGFALQLLVDVAEHALTPASADLSTAQEVLAHLEVILHDLIVGGLPSGHRSGDDDRWVVVRDGTRAPEHVEQVAQRLRYAASDDPLLARQLSDVLAGLEDASTQAGLQELAESLCHERRSLQPTAAEDT